jgi:hypothetical protein
MTSYPDEKPFGAESCHRTSRLMTKPLLHCFVAHLFVAQFISAKENHCVFCNQTRRHHSRTHFCDAISGKQLLTNLSLSQTGLRPKTDSKSGDPESVVCETDSETPDFDICTNLTHHFSLLAFCQNYFALALSWYYLPMVAGLDLILKLIR